MTRQDVVRIYRLLATHGIEIWVDGGFCVDALVGRATREHGDLDIAVEREDAERLCAVLGGRRLLAATPRGQLCMVASCSATAGAMSMYTCLLTMNPASTFTASSIPSEVFTGTGEIDGIEVSCVAPEWMFRFKTAYAPTANDIADVSALANHFGFAIPDSHRS